MRRFLFILFLVAALLPASAKLTRFMLRGYVYEQDYSKTDWQKREVDSVYVSLVQSDTILVPFKMLVGNDTLKLASDGELRLMVDGGVGSYSLLLNRDGYEPLRHDFKVASEGQDVVYLRSLFMEPRLENELHEVQVVGTAIKMVMKGDTIVYDSAAFQLPEGSTLDALVSQLPGAELAADGSITVNGRKVQSLLLNGNDFFKGDPEVALKNLPAYTVDKVKVYDKAAKDDYLTLASHQLSDSPLDENLVMDVVLKKEFSMATILALEGGYGPGIFKDSPRKFDHRYLGRTFILGFGKTYRFSVFGNANNIKNTSRSSSSHRDWSGGWGQAGELDVAIGGFDAYYKPNDRIEARADLQYSREDIEVRKLTSSTRFFDTGNLYSRSRLEQNELRHHVMGNATVEYSGDNIFVRFTPKIDWFRSTSTEFNYNVNFNRNPSELTRGAAIDSLFSLKPGVEASPQLLESVTSLDYQSYRGPAGSAAYPDWCNISGSLYSRLSPKSMRGNFSLNASVTDVSQRRRYGRIYYQTLADASAEPLRREQWNDKPERKTNANAGLTFDWRKRFMNEKLSHNLNISVTGAWSMERNFSDEKLLYHALLEGFDPADRILPSQTAPDYAGALIDSENSIRSLFLNNRAQGSVNVNFVVEPVAPTDHGFNPSLGISASFVHVQHFRHLSYTKKYLDPLFHYDVTRSDPTDSSSLSCRLSSNNNSRYMSFSVDYGYSSSLVNLFTLVPTINNSDPLNIFLGPADGVAFRSPSTHRLSVYFSRYGNVHHESTYINAGWNQSRNAVAQTAVFDPATGVTTHRPVNVNGNWSAYFSVSHFHPFGAKEQWQPSIHLGYNHNNSVDFTSVLSAPVRSVVRNGNFYGSLQMSYTIKNDGPCGGTRFSVWGSSSWQRSTSPREDFHTISSTGSSAGATIDFFLPWQIQGSTDISATFRRGYEDSSLNTTKWVWNASVQKSILKGNLTFKLNAVDILGQLTNISVHVNAQGRTEVWTNNLPRYVMLTVSYRFNYTPRALK